MTVLVATSVVRGSRQGQSHGGVYLVDVDRGRFQQTVDWNTADIDWQGRGWDRGLRGIAFDNHKVYIAASDELFVFDRNFKRLASYRCPYLKHCHEISTYRRRLYLSSTGFDSILGFDLDRMEFAWGLHIADEGSEIVASAFDPRHRQGPSPGNRLHLNNVLAVEQGLYISGLRTLGLLKFDGRRVRRTVDLPRGVHNAMPYRGGVLFNDTESDTVRFEQPNGEGTRFRVPRYEDDELTHTDLGDERIARPGFARGLCVIKTNVIAAGSSPSTIAVLDLADGTRKTTICLSRDIRNAIHGLEVWPF